MIYRHSVVLQIHFLINASLRIIFLFSDSESCPSFLHQFIPSSIHSLYYNLLLDSLRCFVLCASVKKNKRDRENSGNTTSSGKQRADPSLGDINEEDDDDSGPYVCLYESKS